MRDVVSLVVDDGDFFEVHEHFAQNIIVGFSPPRRLSGRDRRQPAQAPRRRARHRVLGEGGALRALLRRLQHPADHASPTCPGFLPGTSQEWDGIIRHGAKLLYAFTEATVPKLTVVTRKAYGGAYDVMNSKHMLADFNFAWPTAEVAVMGPEGAVNIIYRRDIAKSPTPEERREKLIDDYKAHFANPYSAAERGYIDDVIEPHETRPKLIRALRTLQTKRVEQPKRKHGNIPLLKRDQLIFLGVLAVGAVDRVVIVVLVDRRRRARSSSSDVDTSTKPDGRGPRRPAARRRCRSTTSSRATAPRRSPGDTLTMQYVGVNYSRRQAVRRLLGQRPAVHLPARLRPGDPGLGPGHRRDEGRRPARADRAARPRLRRPGPAAGDRARTRPSSSSSTCSTCRAAPRPRASSAEQPTARPVGCGAPMRTNAVLTADLERRASEDDSRAGRGAGAARARGRIGRRARGRRWLAAAAGGRRRPGAGRGGELPRRLRRLLAAITGPASLRPRGARRTRPGGRRAERAAAALVRRGLERPAPGPKALAKRKTTWNVVAELGDPAPSGPWSRWLTTTPPTAASSSIRRCSASSPTCSRRDRADRHRDPGLVGRGGRAGAGRARSRDAAAAGSPPRGPPCPRSRARCCSTSPATLSSRARTTTSAVWRRWSRSPRRCASARSRASACCSLVRGRGGPTGWHLRLRPPPSRRL